MQKTAEKCRKVLEEETVEKVPVLGDDVSDVQKHVVKVQHPFLYGTHKATCRCGWHTDAPSGELVTSLAETHYRVQAQRNGLKMTKWHKRKAYGKSYKNFAMPSLSIPVFAH